MHESQRRYRFPTKCSICERNCQYFFYSVACCDGCKHFFRRSVILKKNFSCKKRGLCNIARGDKCKSCRLDKCILAGMNARTVRSEDPQESQEMLDYLEERRRKLMERGEEEEGGGRRYAGGTAIMATGDGTTIAAFPPHPDRAELLSCGESSSHAQLLSHFLCVENYARKIRDSSTPVPESHYRQNCASLAELISRTENLLLENRQFSTTPPEPLNINAIERIRENGLFSRLPPYLAMDLLFVVEIAKTMPFYTHLCMQDKLCLITNIAMPLVVLANAYYSYLMHSKTVITPAGYAPILFVNGGKYAHDKIVYNLSEKVLTDVMEPFHRVQLSEEEFVLLRAIIYSHMVTNGLTTDGQKLLLTEAEKYSSMLMKILQTNYGAVGGARKYAEALQLVEFCFNSAQHHIHFFNYMASVHERDRFGSVMPGALAQLCTRGNVVQLSELKQI